MRAPGAKLSLIKWRQESILDVYELALGLILFLSPWLFGYAPGAGRVAWISGLAVIVISVSAILAFSEWEEWLNLLLGVWLIIAPWIMGYPHTTAMHVSIGIGVLIVYLALLDLWLIHYPPDAASDHAKRT
jgi:hypothetical protein